MKRGLISVVAGMSVVLVAALSGAAPAAPNCGGTCGVKRDACVKAADEKANKCGMKVAKWHQGAMKAAAKAKRPDAAQAKVKAQLEKRNAACEAAKAKAAARCAKAAKKCDTGCAKKAAAAAKAAEKKAKASAKVKAAAPKAAAPKAAAPKAAAPKASLRKSK